MNRTRNTILTILSVLILISCDFIKNSLTYKDKTKDFVETLIREEYDEALDHFEWENEIAENFNFDEMKKSLEELRELIVSNFGTELNFSFMKSLKKHSTIEEENTPPKTTLAFIQFANQREFGVFQILFDDKSGKILHINLLNVKLPIPSMTFFWLFGLLAICIPVFNIYVIRQIKRSDLNRKWLKYIAVLLFNVPSVTLTAVNGIAFNLLSFQILLGVSFGYMGFLNSYWTFGIPLGGLYLFIKLRQRKNKLTAAENSSTQIVEYATTNNKDTPLTE